jgi:ATP-dependent Lhr-like helicase
MHEGAVEAIRYPRNPLDVAAQQIVAMLAMDAWHIDDLYAAIRRAAPFAELGRAAFDGLLDMLSGRYPSDAFAELRPRITWNRATGALTAREGAKRVAVINGGTIPDRGLYGVFLLGAPPGSARVGELDEEMVFESRIGDVFVLGASSWRIEAITHDRVAVSPAAGQPGKMPFWKGDRPGRPLELGLTIGRLVRDLAQLPPAAAIDRLMRDHDLDRPAADDLVAYLSEQKIATGALPDHSTVVIERVRDEYGDWRVCVLSPRGAPVHAPWAMAVAAKIREETGTDVETLWGDDGFVVRFPDADKAPDARLLLPSGDEAQRLVMRQLGATSLFAGKFRENAARSLLLPKRRPGVRAPLWQQRKRAADLLAVAARYGSFPVLLETYRECLRDFFDIPALVETLTSIERGGTHVATVDGQRPSPFAASLLFNYVAAFLYDGDAPLAERRAQALSVDQTQLRELIGDAELRELLDRDAIDTVESQLQHLAGEYRARSIDALHDLLLAVGDLTADELRARSTDLSVESAIRTLENTHRAITITVANDERIIAIEDGSRYRDALGATLPSDIPESLKAPVRDPLSDLILRYARTHAPFPAADIAARFNLPVGIVESELNRQSEEGRVLQGEFRPGGSGHEWTDPGVLRMIRRRSLAALRHEVEPVDQPALGRFLTTWHGVVRRRTGADALLDVIEQLQGASIAASILETEVLAARLDAYEPADLDALVAAGEVVWVGVEPLGQRDGRVALYLADSLRELLPPRSLFARQPIEDAREKAILETLRLRGASFFASLHEAAGGGYPGETLDALWSLVWQGLITNDTVHVLRAFTEAPPAHRRPKRDEMRAPFRSRRGAPPSAAGRWTLVGADDAPGRDRRADNRATTAWLAASAQQMLTRYGVVTREALAVESIPGGFSAVYPVLKAMDDSGRVRRGYFVAGLGATQFALPGALDLLRSLRVPPSNDSGEPQVAVLAASDPANPYGAALPWPARANASGDAEAAGRGATRTVGATVILVDGRLAAYLARGDRSLITWLPENEPDRSQSARSIARALIDRSRQGGDAPRGMLIEEIDGGPSVSHSLAPFLVDAGFLAGALGFQPTFTALSRLV